MKEQTRTALIRHCKAYPALQIEDIFKYLFHSTMGCEHLVSDADAAMRYMQSEYAAMREATDPRIDELDGAYSRVHLGVLSQGLRPETLAKLFCLSAKHEPNGKMLLAQKLEIARALIEDGTLPLELAEFDRKLAAWRDADFPAVHHSSAFREHYHPAYRVLSNRYVGYLPLFCEIDKLLAQGNTTVAIEGGSASGKSTLASLLQEVYPCNVFHTDDFFLRPEQRTPVRLAEPGGNLDRERFADDVLRSVYTREPVCYSRFDCATQTLSAPICVPPAALTIIEGAYSLHPAFGRYYDLAVFLDIDPDLQQKRISVRNSPQMAKRFFAEWIPMENTYFAAFDIKSKADLLLHVQENCAWLK